MTWLPRFSTGSATLAFDWGEAEGRFFLVEWLGWQVELTITRTERELGE